MVPDRHWQLPIRISGNMHEASLSKAQLYVPDQRGRRYRCPPVTCCDSKSPTGYMVSQDTHSGEWSPHFAQVIDMLKQPNASGHRPSANRPPASDKKSSLPSVWIMTATSCSVLPHERHFHGT